MKNALSAIALFVCLHLSAQKWEQKQFEIIEAINELSKTTAPGGEGAEAYGKILSDDFKRWTMGSENVSEKTEWIEGIKAWFDEGWRVSKRENEFIEISIQRDMAFVRRNVTETYSDDEGNLSQPSKAAVSEVWIYDGLTWKLFRVEVSVLN